MLIPIACHERIAGLLQLLDHEIAPLAASADLPGSGAAVAIAVPLMCAIREAREEFAALMADEHGAAATAIYDETPTRPLLVMSTRGDLTDLAAGERPRWLPQTT